MRKHLHLVAFFFLLFFGGAYSQALTDSLAPLGDAGLSGASPSTPYGTITMPSPCMDSEVRGARLRAILDMGGDYDLGQTAWTAEVDLQIEGFDVSSALILSYNVSLEIDNGRPEAVFDKDIFLIYPDLDEIEVTVTGYTNASPQGQNAIRLRVGYVADIGYDVNGGSPVSVTLTAVTPWDDVTSTAETYTLFEWSPGCDLVPGYEFQLLRLYNENPGSGGEIDVDVTVDWRQALSILTGPEPSLRVTITEGQGCYLWRVRAIGNFYPEGDARNWGAWSTHEVQGSSLTNYNGTGSIDRFFHNQFEIGMNWTHARIFTEGGRIKEQMTYANGLQYSRQSQVYLPSEENTILSQTEYDYSGRAALTALPAPTENDYLRYVPGVLEHWGNPYTQADFDADTTWRDPNDVDGGIVSDYYDGGDPGHMVADAEDYPFSRVLYLGDGNSRVLEQGGPGATHRIGAAATHTTRNFDGAVTTEELVRVLGDEAPAKDGVMKTIALDPNGTASITYTDKSGQVLATCLSGSDTTENPLVRSLRSRPSPFMVSHDLSTTTQRGDAGRWSGVELAISEPTDITIDWALSPADFEHVCANLCQTCDYRVEVRLSRLDDPSPGACSGCGLVYGDTIEPAECGMGGVHGPSSPEVVAVEPGIYLVERLASAYLVDGANVPATYFAEFRDEARESLEVAASTALADVYVYIEAEDLDGLNAYLESELGAVAVGENWEFVAGCCTLQIPHMDCSPQDCDTIDWEGMLVDRWTPEGGPAPDFVDFIPAGTMYDAGGYGFATSGSFNDIVDRMLIKEHIPGGPWTPDFYTCEELYGCWTAIVEGYDVMQAAALQAGQPGFDPVDNFFLCAGYHIQDDTSTVTGDNIEAGWGTHPYGYVEVKGSMNADCEQIVCGGTGCVDTPAEWQDYFFCERGVLAGAGLSPAPSIMGTIGDMESQCLQACEDRYVAFVDMARLHFRNLGETIEDEIVSGSPDVTVAQVYCVAGQLLEECKRNCDFDPVIVSGDTVEVQPAAGRDPFCWMTASIEFGFEDPTICIALSSSSVLDDIPVSGAAVRYLNSLLEAERLDAQYPGTEWEDYVDAIDLLAGTGASVSCTLAVPDNFAVIHPNEHSYFRESTNGGASCDLEYVREGVLMPDPGYFDPDGDLHVIEMIEIPVLNSQTTLTVTFPGTWTLAPTVAVTGGSLTPTGTGSITTSGLEVYFSSVHPAGTVSLAITGGIDVTALCSNLCTLGDFGCDPICARCDTFVADGDMDTVASVTCAQYSVGVVANEIGRQLTGCIDAALVALEADYRATCIEGYMDTFTVSYPLAYHHYTLYHYDRAGNLVRTTPPHGVSVTSTDRLSHPVHRFETRYAYNSLGQLVWQETPDGGETFFWYDDIGRLRFSKNEKQAPGGKYSYTKYDRLGRTIEVGESDLFGGNLDDHFNDPAFPSTGWERVYTVYSTSAGIANHLGQRQRYLENNVSYVYTDDGHYTYFSYDPHGNVDWMVQRVPGLGGDKEIAYEYDLISGKVTKVKYQEGHTDQFFHRYNYDEDNRLTCAETSLDGVVWEKDGRYDYYTHGPLERSVVGEDGVQGLDYVHTIQGWLKGLNHPSLDFTLDPGGDGDANNVGRDAWGMVLGYFAGDYLHGSSGDPFNSESTNDWHLGSSTEYGGTYPGLYNGNISAWTWNTNDIGDGTNHGLHYGTKARAYAYRYDELNRIAHARHYHMNSGNTDWERSVDVNSDLEYEENYLYDGAGNIGRLRRQAYQTGSATSEMDSLTYHYDDGIGGEYSYDAEANQYYHNGSAVGFAALPDEITNRLVYVEDPIGQANPLWNDLDDQAATSPYNYGYDAIGQLVRDEYEDLDMEWTAYHKVASVNKNASTTGAVSEISFGYDAMQRRTTKLVEHLSSADYEKSYYIYDAQGNVMAIYSENSASSVVTTKQDELPIYGSDRLGLVRRNLELGDQAECPYCPEAATIQPGMLRIVEVMYDSPLSNPTETNEGEFIVLRNATGIAIPLGSVSVTYPGGVFTFGGSDVLAPYEFAIVARLAGGTPTSFASIYGLTGYNSDPEVNWFWHNTMTLPDAGGTAGLLDFTGGVPTLLDAVNFGGGGIAASNAAVCSTACNTVQTVQLDNFLTSPPGAFDVGEWGGTTITGKGSIGSGSFVLDNTYERGLGKREYELKDHLGNVRVVVTDKKLSRIDAGLPVEFRADVLLMRDFYAFGMEMPGATFTPDAYRYGFNGQERDDELKGAGMSYDFGARMYDPKVSRWLSTDPAEYTYPMMAPHVAFGNNPIMFMDPDGQIITFADGNGAENSALKKWFWDQYVVKMSPEDQEKIKLLDASTVNYSIVVAELGGLAELGSNRAGGTNLDWKEYNDSQGQKIKVNINIGKIDKDFGGFEQKLALLGDELTHAYQFEIGSIAFALGDHNLQMTLGYDVSDEIESQVGAVNSLYNFLDQIVAQNPDDNITNAKEALESIIPFFKEKGRLPSDMVNAVRYKQNVVDGKTGAKEWLYTPVNKEGPGYSDSDFPFGSKNPETTTNGSSYKVGDNVNAPNAAGKMFPRKIDKIVTH